MDYGAAIEDHITCIWLQVIEAQVDDMPIVGAIALHVSLLTFTLRVHPDRLDYVDQVLVCYFQTSQPFYEMWYGQELHFS